MPQPNLAVSPGSRQPRGLWLQQKKRSADCDRVSYRNRGCCPGVPAGERRLSSTRTVGRLRTVSVVIRKRRRTALLPCGRGPNPLDGFGWNVFSRRYPATGGGFLDGTTAPAGIVRNRKLSATLSHRRRRAFCVPQQDDDVGRCIGHSKLAARPSRIRRPTFMSLTRRNRPRTKQLTG